MGEEDQNDILSKLFEHDLDAVLRMVFFYLDPDSLKQSRCVNWAWNNFIMYRLWNSKAGRKELKKRLESRWRHRSKVPIVHLAETGHTVISMVCDEHAVYCGLSNGSVKVFNLATGNMDLLLESVGANAFVGVNSNIVVSVLKYSGQMSIWNKKDGSKLYNGRSQTFIGTDIMCVKVTEKNIFTGAADGSIAVMELGCGVGKEDWGLKFLIKENIADIKHIESDGEWLIVATAIFVKVFKIEEEKEPSLVANIPESATKLSLSYPYILLVNEDRFEGLRVWNIETQQNLRHIRLNGRMFADIAINGTQVAIMEAIDIDSDEDNFVFVFNLAEVCDINIPVDKLWRRVRIYEKLSTREARVALTSTCLVLSHGNNVNIQDFWKGS